MQFVGYTKWAQLPESADALFAEATQDSIFFSRAWFENLSEHALAQGHSMLLACVVDGPQVLAILPLMQDADGQWESLGHLYSSLFSLLLARHDQAATLACLAKGLQQLPLEAVRLAPVAEQDANLQGLQQALGECGYACHRYFRFYNWIHRLQGQSFTDYMDSRPSRVRNTIARKQRKLAREHGYRIALYTDRELDKGLADFNTVYAASWKAKELFNDFISDLTQRLADQGWLRLAVLYIAEQPAAAQFWFVSGRKASIFKLAYDETWKPYSPGSILIAYLMEHVIEVDKVEEIDFLTGNDTYKQDWMTERRVRWGLVCGKPHKPRGRAQRLLGILKNWTRQRLPFASAQHLSLNEPSRTNPAGLPTS